MSMCSCPTALWSWVRDLTSLTLCLSLPPLIILVKEVVAITKSAATSPTGGPTFQASRAQHALTSFRLQHSSQVPALGFEPSRAESRQNQLPLWSFPVKMCSEEPSLGRAISGGEEIGLACAVFTPDRGKVCL